MTRRRSSKVQARMDQVLACLRESDQAMRCLDVGRQAGLVYSSGYPMYGDTYTALTNLEKEGLVERVGADQMRRRACFDGRSVELGPEASAVGWRANLSPSDVAELESLWLAPAFGVDRHR